MIEVAGGLLLAGVLVLWLAGRLQRRSGLPSMAIRYEDTHRRESAVLRSERYRLSGKPDYLLEARDGTLLPVEVKPTRRARAPYQSDLMQLAAYCLLVEEMSGTPPPYAILRYAEQSWEIPWDRDLRQQLLTTLDEMDRAERQPSVERSHQQAARCRGCGLRAHCDQALA